MNLSDAGVEFIASHEGRRHVPYNDALGHCTVGIGHLLHQGGCTATEFARMYSDAEVDDLFRVDVQRFVDAVNRYVRVALSRPQFDALVSFAFNWGVGEQTGFPATSICRLVNERRFAEVPAELVNGRGPRTSEWPDGRPYDKSLAGVRNRRIAEGELFASGTAGGHTMKLVSRAEWGARPPIATTEMDSRLRGVACHWEGPHMGTPDHGGTAAAPRLHGAAALAMPDRIAAVTAALAVLEQPAEIDRRARGLGPPSPAAVPADIAAARATVASASCYELVASIQAFHMGPSRGWNDIAYNALPCPHGYVFEGRGPGLRSGANGDANVNATHYAVCFLGGEGDEFTAGAKDGFNDAAEWLGQADGEWVGHRDLTQTACPGDEIYGWVHDGHPRGNEGSTTTPLPEEDEDMATWRDYELKPGETKTITPPPRNGSIPFGDRFLSAGTTHEGSDDKAKIGVHLWGQSDYFEQDLPPGRKWGVGLSDACDLLEVTNLGTVPLGVLIEVGSRKA